MYDVTTLLTNNCNTHLPHISRSKSIQAMKFCQLIEYNMRNSFFEKSNVLEKLFPDPFLKNQNWAYVWIKSLKLYTVCFYCMPSLGLSKYIETKLQSTWFFSYKICLENKKRSGTSFPIFFSAWFLEESISLVIFY